MPRRVALLMVIYKQNPTPPPTTILLCVAVEHKLRITFLLLLLAGMDL